MIKKSDLEHGRYYRGKCRNSKIAVWSGTQGKFWYMRTKWSATFPEKINHPEDDNGFDLFVPTELATPTEAEVVPENFWE